MASVSILGAGTWGIALARMLTIHEHNVCVWSAIPDEIEELKLKKRQRNLPDICLPDCIDYTTDIQLACTGRDILVIAVPSIYVRGTVEKISSFLCPGQIIVTVAKGLETISLMTMSEVIASVLADAKVVALSGPTHAEEVAQDLPTTIVAACSDLAVAERVQTWFANPRFRVYTSTDVKGVELCGALKNIIALAAGISTGLGYGDNATAAIITRGLAEIKRIGLGIGACSDTFFGLAGMGDLIVTAVSKHSRNNRCGYLIGQGCSPEEAISQVGMVVEGINALPAAIALSKELKVEVPIIYAVDDIVNHGCMPEVVVNRLMERELTMESR